MALLTHIFCLSVLICGYPDSAVAALTYGLLQYVVIQLLVLLIKRRLGLREAEEGS